MANVSSNKPEFLPLGFWSIYLDMKARGVLSDRDVLLFIDERLIDFWEYVSSYTALIDQQWLADAESFIVGSILNPLDWYSQTGTAVRPTLKNKVRERQKKADVLFNEIAELACQLSEKLDKVSSTTNYFPDQIYLSELLQPLTEYDLIKTDIASNRLLTANLINDLHTAFRDYPRSDRLFTDVPGMNSQKSSWRDWMAEAKQNLSLLLDMYGKVFEIREKHWLALVNVLIDKNISRTSVNAALNNR